MISRIAFATTSAFFFLDRLNPQVFGKAIDNDHKVSVVVVCSCQ